MTERVLALSLRFIGVVLLLALLVACESATVVEDRGQREAIEIVALLHDRGISATVKKDTGNRGRYSIQVDKEFRGEAQTLLWQKGFPKESEATFEDLTSPRGLIPNSREADSLRLDRALAAELEEMLRAHPNVGSVRAIVRLNYLKEGGEPTVSIIAQEKTDVKLVPESLKELVTRAVPGIKRENILVSLQPGEKQESGAGSEGVFNDSGKVIRKPLVPFLYWYLVPDDTYAKLALTLFACLVVVSVAGALGGYWFGYFQGSKSTFDGGIPDIGSPRGLKSDAKGRKDLPGSMS